MQSTGKNKLITLVAMTLGFVMVQLDVTVVNVAIKTIGKSVGGNISSLQWVVNAYTLTFAALILTAGALGDRIGAKRVFITGFSVFTIASLGCGLAPNLPLLIIFRAVQGLGAAILVPCSLALLSHAYTNPDERSKAVGIWAAGASSALAAGPIIGGALIAFLGWRSIFFINIPIGITGIWLTAVYTTETGKSKGRSIDIWGQIVVGIALACLAASMIEGGKLGWTNLYILLGFALFALFMALFILIENKTKDPMLPLVLFKIRNFSATTAIGFFINISFYGLIFVFSLYFQQLRGLSPLKTGIAFLPAMGAILMANLLAGRLAKGLGPKKVILIGALCFLAGSLVMLDVSKQTAFLWVALPLFAMGLGVGLIVPPMTSAMLGSVDKSQSGVASGVLNSMRQAGSVIGVALFGSLVAKGGQFINGMHLSLIITASLIVLSMVAAFAISKS